MRNTHTQLVHFNFINILFVISRWKFKLTRGVFFFVHKKKTRWSDEDERWWCGKKNSCTKAQVVALIFSRAPHALWKMHWWRARAARTDTITNYLNECAPLPPPLTLNKKLLRLTCSSYMLHICERSSPVCSMTKFYFYRFVFVQHAKSAFDNKKKINCCFFLLLFIKCAYQLHIALIN